jgi:hypothetical protein
VSIELQKFQGGGTMGKAAAIGVLGTGAAIVGLFMDRKAALFSYLIGFTYWAGVALSSLILLMIFHAFRAKWMVVIRRALEAMAATVPLFLLLIIPILIYLPELYSWVNPEAAGIFTEHELHILHEKHSYLNTTGFVLRTLGYLVVATLIGWRLWGLSTRQDVSGDPALTQKQRNLGTGALPLMAMVITFAGFDWLMSLNPIWFSTIFGVYYFAGSFISTFSILIIVTTLARDPKRKDLYGHFVSPEHMQNLGKLLFGFICFWGYVAFSQMMLIWIANLPEEIPFYTVRMKGDWAPVGVALIICHFVIPFSLLLSRDIKRKPPRLSLVALWVLLVHLLDLFWLVMPTLDSHNVKFSIWIIPAWLGIGGLAVAFGLWKIRGHYTLPVKDPFLDVSLRYRQPT